jgi:hypothetical protein
MPLIGDVEAAGLASTCRVRESVETKEAAVKYLLLIYVNPASRKVWEALPEDQRAEGFRAHAALDEDLAASGELIVTEALADESLAKRVSVREGKRIASDGPFAEAKEFLAGIYLLECESMDRAVEVAARMPEAPIGEIEVRPVMDLKGMEM